MKDGQAVTGSFAAVTQAIMPSADVLHLHLLRHGEVGGFTQRAVRGHRDDDVSAVGREQHARLATSLAAAFAQAAPRPGLIVSSDLRRCRDLAERVGAAFGLPVAYDSRLREQAMGEWEGRTWDELTREHGAAVSAWWADATSARAPGGESLSDLAVRVGAWWRELRATHGQGRVIVVSHTGVLRVLCCELLALPLHQALRFSPAAASHTQFSVAQAGAVLQALGERPWMGSGTAVVEGPSAGAEPAANARAASNPPVALRPSAAPGRGLRLAVSGSAGTGKTTLGRRLAADLGVPYLEEGMRRRIERGLQLHLLSPAEVSIILRELWNEQREREEAASATGFVADRCSADYAAFWIHYGLHHLSPSAAEAAVTEDWIASCLQRLDRYDRVLLFPWGALPLREDGVRSTNRWTQFQYQSVLETMLRRHAPSGLVLPVSTSDDLELRLRFVRAELEASAAPQR
ncbi:MAG: histidine phosphatase family protein [Planctomycetota bacterium]